MIQLKNFKGKSQYEDDIDEYYRNSACGPVTAYVLLRYHSLLTPSLSVNSLYDMLGCTKMGLFRWRFIRNLQKIVGPHWQVSRCTIEDVAHEMNAGRPVAAKFDKWFSFRWFGHYSFQYHWVPVIGYIQQTDDIILLIDDNGAPNRKNKQWTISYQKNKAVLSFVQLRPI